MHFTSVLSNIIPFLDFSRYGDIQRSFRITLIFVLKSFKDAEIHLYEYEIIPLGDIP